MFGDTLHSGPQIKLTGGLTAGLLYMALTGLKVQCLFHYNIYSHASSFILCYHL
jgi:hypothetical protein